MTLLEKLNKTPPFVFRYLAKVQINHTTFRPMTNSELATRAGLSVHTIRRLSNQTSWRGWLEFYDPFVMACGFNPTRPSKAIIMLKRICAHPNGLASARHVQRNQSMACARAQQIKRLLNVLKGKE